jgi:geranylgeranyl pyrophosphate synthase
MADETEFPEAEMAEIARQRIARDDDYATIDLAIKINDSIERTAAWQYVMQRAQIDRDEALAKLAEIPAQDQNAIRALQQRARFAVAIKQWLMEIDERAKEAHERILHTDGLLPDDSA